MSYVWNRIFQFLWLVILICDFGVKAIDGVDLVDRSIIYGYNPTLDIIMFFDGNKQSGIGVSTIADVWIGLFPISMFLIYLIFSVKIESEEAGTGGKYTEMTGQVKNEKIAYDPQRKYDQLAEGGEIEMEYKDYDPTVQ